MSDAERVMSNLWPILGGNHTDADTWHRINDAVSAALQPEAAPVVDKSAALQTLTDALTERAKSIAAGQLAEFLNRQIDGVARDMAAHVGDQIFDVLKRHGLMMRSEAVSTAMQVLAAVQVLSQAVDQCSRAAEADCTDAVARLFIDCLPEQIGRAVREVLKGEG